MTTRALPAIPETNNIGLLRLLLAAIVLCVHAEALSSSPSLWLFRHANAELAVQGFFVLSGFLVVMSYERAKGLRDYAAKRLRRIYPAYCTVILLCAFGGAAVTVLPLDAYFGGAWVRYVLANLSFLNFLQPDLPGVFTQNRLTAVNGALWTIKVEMCFYLMVPLFVWLWRTRFRLGWMLLIYAGAFAYAALCAHLAVTTGKDYFHELGRQLPGQMAYFTTGAALYYYHAWAMRHRVPLVVIAIVVVALSHGLGMFIFYPAALGVLVMALAFGPFLGNAEKYGDLSYGLYIWHFPILQLLVVLGVFAALGGVLAFVLAAAVSLLVAWGSWHLVEKRFLRRASHYRVVT